MRACVLARVLLMRVHDMRHFCIIAWPTPPFMVHNRVSAERGVQRFAPLDPTRSLADPATSRERRWSASDRPNNALLTATMQISNGV